MTWKTPAITHIGTDWTPFIKQYGDALVWDTDLMADFQKFLFHFKDQPFIFEPRQKNAADFFRMAISVLAPLTPQQRSVVNDWPTLRKLIDETYFTQEAVRARRKAKKQAIRAARIARTETDNAMKAAHGKQPEPAIEVSKTPLGKFRRKQGTP
jgi:hypothetical protein